MWHTFVLQASARATYPIFDWSRLKSTQNQRSGIMSGIAVGMRRTTSASRSFGARLSELSIASPPEVRCGQDCCHRLCSIQVLLVLSDRPNPFQKVISRANYMRTTSNVFDLEMETFRNQRGTRSGRCSPSVSTVALDQLTGCRSDYVNSVAQSLSDACGPTNNFEQQVNCFYCACRAAPTLLRF